MASWFSSLSGGPALLIGGLSLLTFFGTLILLPVLLIRIPEDYFIREKSFRFRRGIGGFLFHLIKNGLGLLFVVMGFIMLFIPGQGLLTILAGLWLMDLPGKRALEIRLVSNPTLYKGIDYIRRKSGHPSLRLPEDEADESPGDESPGDESPRGESSKDEETAGEAPEKDQDSGV